MTVATSPFPDRRTLLTRILPGVLVFLALVTVLGVFFRVPLLSVGTYIVGRFGLGGIFLACYLLDSVPGVGAQPMLFLGYTGGLGILPLLGAATMGGVLAGATCWAVGRLFGRTERVKRWAAASGMQPWLRDRARSTVFAAAILPFPFAAACLAAGAAGAPLGDVLIGATGRAPKALLNLLVIASGWSLGG